MNLEEEFLVETVEEEHTEENEEFTAVDYEEEALNSIVDLERTKETIFYTPSGDIHLIHQITLGDVIVIMLLSCIIIFMLLDRVVRR